MSERPIQSYPPGNAGRGQYIHDLNPGPSRVSVFFTRLLLAVLGLTVGLGFYVWNLLGRPGFTEIPIVDDFIPGSHGTETDPTPGTSGGGVTDVSGNPSVPVNPGEGKGGVVRVYAPPGYPIEFAEQKDSGVLNILIFGVDSQDQDAVTGNSDAMIVMSLDKYSNTIKLTSLLRDTEVVIEGREGQKTKLNSAYAYGGVGLMINTINQNFDLDIQSFMMFDFWSAASIIDKVGGIEVPVTAEELQHVNAGVRQFNRLSGIDTEDGLLAASGTQLLTGKQAIGWARIRAIGFDYARTSRQRYVITAMLERFGAQDAFAKLTTASEVLANIETNISRVSMVGIGTRYMSTLQNMDEYRVPEDGYFTTDTSNWNIIVDWDRQLPRLHDYIYGDSD